MRSSNLTQRGEVEEQRRSMAAGYRGGYHGGYSGGYSGRGYSGGYYGGGGGYSGSYSRGDDYYGDFEPMGGGPTRVNPEYYQRERGYGFEGTRAGALDPSENPVSKKRKIDNVTICVDFVRGFCIKGARCPKPHVDYVESIDEREIMAKLKFCHDFQNKGMCVRSDCKFLHVTRREEDEFLLTGTIPQSVFERMSEWTMKYDPNFRSFDREQGGPPGMGGGPSPNSTPRGRGRMFGGGPRPSFQSPTFSPRGGGMHGGPGVRPMLTPSFPRSHGGRGGISGSMSNTQQSGPGYMSGTGHSSNQPVTYGNYCVDFLKGTCSRGQACGLKHVESVDDPEDRDGLVKQVFCHDFQNNNCQRPFCKYVHANRQEETFFLENGFFSPSLNARNREKMFFSSICIDYLRNQCIRGQSCHYKHVTKVDSHNERICLSRSIFCHDYQEGGCSRPNCKLVHSGKQDEQFFLRTGTLPDQLRVKVPAGGTGVDVSHLTGNVCREFVKNMCTRGASCRFYHPTPAELHTLLAQQAGPTVSQVTKNEQDTDLVLKENEELKARVQQLERLLADACHCITLAVGDQNPAIATLMKTIAEMAPASSLANQSTSEADGSVNGVQIKGAGDGATQGISVINVPSVN